MNKKIIAILTAMALTVGACACSKTEESKKTKKTEEEEETTTTEEEEEETTTSEEETTTTEEETTTSEEETEETDESTDESTDDTDFEFTLPEADFGKIKNQDAEALVKEMEEAGWWVLGIDASDPDTASEFPEETYGFYGMDLMTGSMVMYIETTEEGMKEYKENPDLFADSGMDIQMKEDGDMTYIYGGSADDGYIWGFLDFAENRIYFYAGAEDNAETVGKEYATKLGYSF